MKEKNKRRWADAVSKAKHPDEGSIQSQFPSVEHDLSGTKQMPNWNNQMTGAVYENFKKSRKRYGNAYKKAMK